MLFIFKCDVGTSWNGWPGHGWVELVEFGAMIDIKDNRSPNNNWLFCLGLLGFTKGNHTYYILTTEREKLKAFESLR